MAARFDTPTEICYHIPRRENMNTRKLTSIGLKFVLPESQIWISSCLSAIAHSIGQMIVALWATGTPSFLIYLPVLILCGIVAGLFTGLCAQLLVKRGKNLWKTIFR